MQKPQPSPSPTTYSTRSRRKLILTFGIVSLVLVPLCGLFANVLPSEPAGLIFLSSFLIAVALGIVASVMALEELRKIRSGHLPVSARGLTKTGGILGLSGTVVYSLVFCVVLFQLFTSSGISSPKDYMINDLNNLAANAYQYRIRPESVGGGGSSYTGFAIPARMSRNENGIYTATVIHTDTIQFYAKCVTDSMSTITVSLDADGRLSRWTYTGNFQ